MNNLIPPFIANKNSQKESEGFFEAFTMFVDISGFTNLTEKLMKNSKDGAEILSDSLNRVFNPLVKNIFHNKGFISNYGGDSFTAIFKNDLSVIDKKNTYIYFINTAIFTRIFFKNYKTIKTIYGDFNLNVKIGLSYGGIKWCIVGNGEINTYYFKGNAIDGCVNSESIAKKGEIVLDKNCLQQLKSLNLQISERSSEYYLLENKSIISYNKNELDKSKDRFLNLKLKDMTTFFLDEVINNKEKAEFRDIVSVFISIDESNINLSLDNFISTILASVYNYGGYFNRVSFGDKAGTVLILLGAPVSYENNISRALDFILNLQKNKNLSFKAGITYGSAYTGFIGGREMCEYTAIGDSVNLASRFMVKASNNSVLVCDKIYNEFANTYKFKDLGSSKFKGKTGSIKTYQLVSKIEVNNPSTLFEGKMIGRKRELKLLEKFVKPIFTNNKSFDKLRTSFAGVTYIYGEAGLGKSRLIWEMKKSITSYELRIMNSKLNWFYLPCEQILRKSFNPVIYFLKKYFNVSEENSKSINRSNFNKKYNALLISLKDLSSFVNKNTVKQITSEFKRTKSLLAGYLNIEWKNSLFSQLDSKGRYDNFIYAFKNLIKAESLTGPVIIQIEDFHWIDSDSKKLFNILVHNIEEFPIALIVSSRYNDDGSEPQLDISSEVIANKIDLNYLSRKDIGSYGKTILKIKDNFSDELLDLIHEKTSGNPFFVEQLLLDLKDKGVINVGVSFVGTRKGKPQNQLSVNEKELQTIPLNIQSIVVSRLDRLSKDVKKVVQTASVIGREFLVKILTDVLRNDKQLDTKLESIKNEKIWSALSEMNYLFKHSLLRDSAYDMQLRAKQKELHEFVAKSYERIFDKKNIEEYYGEIAYHYEKAEVDDKTIEYLEKAADYAKGKYYNTMGLEFYDKLIYKLSTVLTKKNKNYQNINITTANLYIDILFKKGTILQLIGKWGDAILNFNDLLKFVRKLSDSANIAKVNNEIGLQYFLKGNHNTALKYFEESLNLSLKYNNKEAISRVLGNIGVIYSDRGDYHKASNYFNKKIKISEEIEDEIGIAIMNGNLGLISSRKGDYKKSLFYHEKHLQISMKLKNKREIARANGNIAIIYAMENKNIKAMKYFKMKLKIMEEIGNLRESAMMNGNIGIVYENMGDNKKALRYFYRQLSICTNLNDVIGISIASGNIGSYYKKMNEYNKSITNYEKAITIGKELNIPFYICSYMSGSTESLYYLKNYKEAKISNENCLVLANKINKNETIFVMNIFKEKIEFKLSSSRKKKLQNIENLKILLKEQEEEKYITKLEKEILELQNEL